MYRSRLYSRAVTRWRTLTSSRFLTSSKAPIPVGCCRHSRELITMVCGGPSFSWSRKLRTTTSRARWLDVRCADHLGLGVENTWVRKIATLVARSAIASAAHNHVCSNVCCCWAVKQNSSLLSPDAGAFPATEVGTNYQ